MIPEVGNWPGSRRTSLPEMLRPQLATLVSQIPEGENWIHEIKFDGYRALCRVEGNSARFFTREGKDWTDRFGRLPAAAAKLPVTTAILDGEVVVLKPDGTTSFQELQNALKRGSNPQLVYYAFDLLYIDGFDLRQVSLLKRKEALASILRNPASPIRYSDHYHGESAEFLHHVCERGLEGVISKRGDRPYVPGRGADWVKSKCLNRQEFVIGGFTDPAGSRTGFGAILVGVYANGGDLLYCGRVGTGYSARLLSSLRARLGGLEQAAAPFSNPPKGSESRHVHWVKPELVAEVEFTGWTRDGVLRHPSFEGLREDKSASSVHRETAVSSSGEQAPPQSSQGHSPRSTGKRLAGPEVGGVRITNPDKILYRDSGITKLEMAEYYESIAEWILPHLVNRPLTLVRCPEGFDRQCFYQKHAADNVPEVIRRVSIPEEQDVGIYLAIDSAAGLISLVQMGVLEMHPWGSRVDQLERPDRMTFDLDPDPSVPWRRVVEAAFEVRLLLEGLGLKSFPKTTGGKGLHVVVPLLRKKGWNEVKEFSRVVAETMAREAPDRYTAVMSKAKRRGKIFIDYLRNGRGATAVAAYSSRARAGAPVSTPMTWEELEDNPLPGDFSVRTVPQRLRRVKRDPWEGFAEVRQAITATMWKKLGRAPEKR